ncbi:regulatory protein, tetR family [Sinosporangium album]|uniref:Regulatory protein, tetR family n=1 Tax=Sinosporangium album TaxID=504805 RepID=A0A1G8KF96_9ACTN|nr:TetR family transcriptional regulator C-terminal domain-containing protein [Sinosporangium album]SDI42101.1 regulatory protein, tetR family [Sinosporangium album]
MPKQVDYEARRRHIAEAVCDLIDRHGPEGVTLRDVAQQADVSMGAVQRCFATKDEMLAFALHRITERVTAQGQEEIAASAVNESAVTLLTATLRTIALIEPHQRRDARIMVAFTAHATAIPTLAEILRQAHAKTRDLLAWLIRYGQQTGAFRDDLDVDLEAETLLSLVEGSTSLALLGHRPTVPARDMLTRRIDGLLMRPSRPSRPASSTAIT